MQHYNMDKLLATAIELATRTFIREEVKVKSLYSSIDNARYGCKRFERIVWRKINELAQRVYRDNPYEPQPFDVVVEEVHGWKSDRVHVSNTKTWLQIWVRNNLYLLTYNSGRYYITSSEMGTFLVVMPLDRLRDMLIAFDAYLSTDIMDTVIGSVTKYHAQLKADEMLTKTALSMLSDMLKGTQNVLKIRQHKDRMYCEVKDNTWWGKKASFRTSLVTLREDFTFACLKAGVPINIRLKNNEMLQLAAEKRFEYQIFQHASCLSNADIYPKVHGNRILEDALVFRSNIIDVFDLPIELWTCHFASAVNSAAEARTIQLPSPFLLFFLSFLRVSPQSPLVITIEGEPVEFTRVRMGVDEPIAGLDANGEPKYANINVKLTSKDKKTVLLLNSMFTEYLTFGKADRIDEYVFGKHYRKMRRTLEKLGLKFENGSLMAATGGTKVYAKGLNQLLVNAVGASDHFDNEKVYMGSIMYRFPDHVDGGKLENYTKAHEAWARGLNSLPAASGVKVIETPFVYQDLFSGINASVLPEKVKEYYKL